MIQLGDEYKLFPIQEGEDYLIHNKIRLDEVVRFYYSHSYFNMDMTIENIKKWFDIDVSHALKSLIDKNKHYAYFFEYDFNVFERFRNVQGLEKTEDKTRQYFTSKGRNRFLKFVNWVGYNPRFDFLTFTLKPSDVHHIYPLVYGGDNNFENLIYISSYNHDILHANPLENVEKLCHQSVVYLWTLYNSVKEISRLIEKYAINNYKHDLPMAQEIHRIAVKREMNDFYKVIEEKYKEFSVF